MKTPIRPSHTLGYLSPAIAFTALALAPVPGQAQLTSAQISELQNVMGSRVEALTILGGDYGVSGGSYNASGDSRKDADLTVSKFGGSGDVGDPKHLCSLGSMDIRWQPRFQGSMGTVDAENDFHGGALKNDTSEFETFAIQFGGGARFWFNDHLSVAPTFMGMYGHTENDYTARSAAGRANVAQAEELGLVNWEADTWTVRPSANVAYVHTWRRINFTFSTEFTYYHTESFDTSNSNLDINEDSETWKNLIDVDIPLGKKLFGHELRTGGFFSRTELYDSIEKGLNTDHIYEVHGRVVLDFLGELWKVKWLGLGASYLWGSNFDGYSFGADVAFRF